MNDINLLPWRTEQSKLLKKLLIMEIVIVGCFTLAAIIAMHFVYSTKVTYHLNQNRYLQQEISRLTNENNDLIRFEKLREQYEASINFIHSLQFYRFVGVSLLNTLTPIIPKEINLVQIKFENKDIELQGNSTSNFAVSNLVAKIDGDEQFSHANITEVSVQKDKDSERTSTTFVVTFSFNTKYKPIKLEKKP